MLCLYINECENDELNMCSDVCINYDGGHSCQCPSGKSLSLNGERCDIVCYRLLCLLTYHH